jgi:spore coat polysaccharide biosynthesis protein SpsF (cytidylyltransferase family)
MLALSYVNVRFGVTTGSLLDSRLFLARLCRFRDCLSDIDKKPRMHNKVKTAVIVQARMGSHRLPGKVLKDLAGTTALARCLRRCQRIRTVQTVVCAVPEAPENRPIAQEAERSGATVIYGPSDDVLARYVKAARAVGADRVIRITSDCPLIDPEICDQMVRFYEQSGADYGCNNMPPTWPHGLDCEIFSSELLYRADENAHAPHEREHVTPWIRTHPKLHKANFRAPSADLAQHRWTLDYAED